MTDLGLLLLLILKQCYFDRVRGGFELIALNSSAAIWALLLKVATVYSVMPWSLSSAKNFSISTL